MAKKTGTSTDYIDLLNDLVTFITEQAAASAVVAAAGTGYSVSDVLTVSGGTFGTAATFTVLTVGGSGEVLTISTPTVEGDYTAIPSNPVSTTVAPAGGSGCTLTVTWKQKHGWTLKRESEKATTSAVTAGGTGYTVNDQLTLSGGGYETQAVYNVDTVSGGVVTAVSIVTAGNYWKKPTSPITTTGGTGTGCTLTPVWAPVTAQDKEVILMGEGGGSDQIYVGIRTYPSSSARNWECAGFTGYDADLAFENQPGISPGRYDGAAGFDEGAFVPLSSTTITYWFYVDSYSIRVIPRLGSTYLNMYLGFLDRFGTAAEMPYPLLIMGCSSDPDKLFSDSGIGFSGMCDPHTSADTDGPGWLRTPGGTWLTVQNSYVSAGFRNSRTDCVVYPCGAIDHANVPAEDRTFTTNFVTNDLCPSSGSPGIAAAQLLQTPDSPDDNTILLPATIVESRSATDYGIHGQMRNVYWFNALTGGSSIVAEDTITIGGDVYKVFQNVNRSDHFALFCIKDE
jgi:hypothetical protein